MPACAFWPYTTPAPAPEQAPFPSVPTLILSGADDLRTPTANAREVAAQIPGSHLLVVPNIGHSVLGTDLTDCASDALQALFKPSRSSPARPRPQLLSLLTDAAGARRAWRTCRRRTGSHGLPGRTLAGGGADAGGLRRQQTLRRSARSSRATSAGSLAAHRRAARRLGGRREQGADVPRLLLRPGRDRLRASSPRSAIELRIGGRGRRARHAAPRRPQDARRARWADGTCCPRSPPQRRVPLL